MKQISKYSLLLILIGSITLLSCKRKEVDFLGPGYISAPEGFGVTSFTATTATPSSVDFTSDKVIFDATFTHTVTWTLTITGQKSGAVKIYRGVSNGLNIEWKGDQGEITFFRTGEPVSATLSFFGSNLNPTNTIVITKAPDYTTCGQFPMYGDFENRSKVEPSYGPPIKYSDYYASFNFPDPIPNVQQGVDSMAIDYKGNKVPAVQGEKYYFIKGKGNQSNFVSGIQYFGPRSITLPNTPDDVWVNIYIYGTGDANGEVQLEYQESDINRGLPGYQGDTDDAFVAYISLNHKGWKLFSFRYSELTPSKNLNFGGSGNHIPEPHRLVSFNVILIKKSLPESPVEVYFDYPIITVGGPFKPCH
jgi:hypothetical protein